MMELFENNIKELTIVAEGHSFCYRVKLEDGEEIEITYDPHREIVLVGTAVVNREKLAEWLKANGYDENKLVGEEINAATEDFEYDLDIEYYSDAHRDKEGRFVLMYDKEKYWVEELLEVTDIYDFYKHFYSELRTSLACFIFDGDKVGVVPDTKELLIYWYKKFGWHVKSSGDNSIVFYRQWKPEDIGWNRIVDVAESEECIAVSFVDGDFMKTIREFLGSATLTYDAFIEAIESGLIPDQVALPVKSSNGPVIVDAIDVLRLSFETEIEEVNERIRAYREIIEGLVGEDIWDRILESIDDIYVDFEVFDHEGTVKELLVEALKALFKEEEQRAVAEKVERIKVRGE